MRSVPWQRKPTSEVKENIAKVAEARLFLVQEKGPSCFVISDGSKGKYEVRIGNLQSCSCPSPSICIHILFVMLKVYRLPPENPLTWQLSLVDDEIEKIVAGRARAQRLLVEARPVPTEEVKEGKKEAEVEVERREPLEDEVCPICLDDLADQDMGWCRYECLNHYAQHALSTGTPIKCPLCRHNWGQFEFTPPSTLQSRGGSRPVYTTNILCDHCHSTISSAIFNCLYCTSYHLCESCYTKNPMPHSHHSFLYKASPSSPWTEPPMAMLAAQLQNRELTPDDYDLLLQLDSDAQTVLHPRIVAQPSVRTNPEGRRRRKESSTTKLSPMIPQAEPPSDLSITGVGSQRSEEATARKNCESGWLDKNHDLNPQEVEGASCNPYAHFPLLQHALHYPRMFN
ncbi:hypothetical protein PROFUN_09041 [Planoprotostelium fungivorum]|uniref:SWIM-type domain-containing protein n=1 Tax=Planoprotostelium fungivorum TaxID=1890364 RepID=A0A2P6MV18_9EUKA|nr:hypothetical protein PROFUN_09041 [Planoprotostelium fungivorum]